MSKNWVNLHNHTTFSMLDGHGAIEEYAEHCKSLQMSSLAITDHGNIHGWINFYHECKSNDIKPIFGLEAYQARKTRFDRDEEERAGKAEFEWAQRGPYHLTVIAQNKTGYHNLIKLSSRAFTEGFYVKPRVDHELISQYSDGLIVLSGCLNGEVQQAILRGDPDYALEAAAKMQDIVGKDNYFIEIQDHGLKEQSFVKQEVLNIAKKINAKVVCTGDCHYVKKEHAHHHDAMLCVMTGATIDQEDRFKFSGPEFYVKSYDEMATLFEEEWLENTCHIADMVDVDLSFDKLHFPTFPDVPRDKSVDEFLEELVWDGAGERYGLPLSQEIVDRIKYELHIVKNMGFQEYFLVVGDIVRWAKENDIMVGWGRGSAAGSILSYCLHITNLDPLRFGLLFERFLVEGRKSMPDIDLDFDDRYRDKVIDYARSKYGDERVAHIITFSRVKAKTAIRDAARVLGMPYETGDALSKMMPPPILGETQTLEESMSSVPELREAYSQDTYREVINTALGIEGVVRHTGVHAAGIVIAPGTIEDYVPVLRYGDDKLLTTQWDMDHIEQCGMLKVDFLGLRNLGVIDMCLKLVEERHGTVINLNDINLDDAGVYKDLCEGNCQGVFQLESDGMRDMMVALQPENLEDIMALVSLYRPGPMGSGMDKMYVNRKHGREKVEYAHPYLEEILGGTYGIMLYQEDVLNVAKGLAGFSSAEADDLRKAIGKKKMDLIPLLRKKFVEGCTETHGVSESVSNKIYSDIEYFAGYGFNRAHAASYAMVSYITAYLKHHYTVEYMAAAISSVAGKSVGDAKNRTVRYLNECNKLSINILPPSLQRLNRYFGVVDDSNIIFGLQGIAGIGPSVIDAMQNGDNQYSGIYDFFRKCDNQLLNKGTLMHLINAGALDEMVPDGCFEHLDKASKLSLLNSEKAELGFYVTDHPLGDVWEHIKDDTTTNIADLVSGQDKTIVKVGGVITGITKKLTKRNDTMYILQFEDITDSVEVLVFPNVLKNMVDNFWDEGDIGILAGQLVIDNNSDFPLPKIFYNKFTKYEVSLFSGGKPIVMNIDYTPTTAQIDGLISTAKKYQGDSEVLLRYLEDGKEITIQFNDTADYTATDDLKAIIEKENEYA